LPDSHDYNLLFVFLSGFGGLTLNFIGIGTAAMPLVFCRWRSILIAFYNLKNSSWQ